MGQRADAVVIGGGPAGSVAAIVLANVGWRVVLIERRARGRGKACGHCLNSRALPLLDSIGAGSMARQSATGRFDRLRVHFQHGMEIELPLGGRHGGVPGIVVERRRFDQALIDVAASRGVAIVQRQSARVMGRSEKGARVAIGRGEEVRLVECGLVVGADGLRSRVAMAAGLARAGRGCGRKFGFSFDVASPMSGAFDPAAVHMFVAEHGYLGVARQGSSDLHIAVLAGPDGGESRTPRAFCRLLAARFPMLERAGLADAGIDGDVEIHAIGPMPWRSKAIANEWAVLVGDAAGYVEPFTGEGMSWAIESAIVLGEAARSCEPGRWSAGAASEYARRWRARIGAGHRSCRAVAWLLERSSWCGAIGRLAMRHPARAERIIHRLVPT